MLDRGCTELGRITKRRKNEAKVHQTKEQDKFPETNSYETELYDFPNRGLKVTLVKMLSRAQRTMKQRVKNYNKKTET